jgi:hypothetical protein
MSQPKIQAIGFLLALGCFFTHHMAVLLVLYAVSFIMVSVQVNQLLPRVRLHRRAWTAMFNGVVGLSILLVASLLYDYWGELEYAGSAEDAIFSSGPQALVVLMNVGVSYTHQIGFVLFVAILGVAMLFRESSLTAKSLFPIALVLAFLPLLSRSIYVSMLLAPFVAVIGTYWIVRQLARPSRRKATVILVSLLIVVSIALPIWSVQRWNGTTYIGDYTVEVGPEIFSDAAYMEMDYADRDALANSKIVRLELAAASDVVFLGSGVQLLINGEITLEDVHANSSWTSADFPTNLYAWFEYTGGPMVDIFIHVLMVQGVGYVAVQSALQTDMGRYFSRHTNLVIAIDNDHPTSYVTEYSVHECQLAEELKDASWESTSGGEKTTNDLPSYLVYCSGQTSCYIVQLPV